ASIAILALIVGDAVHNLRTALDHRTWEIVSPHCGGPADLKKVQFPIAKSLEDLDKTFEAKMINKAPQNVIDAFGGIRPYRGGNEEIVLIHDLDVMDKHKLLIPSASYASLEPSFIRSFIPTFPAMFEGNMTVIKRVGRDVEWTGFTMTDANLFLHPTKVEQDIPVPVEVIISEPGNASEIPLFPTLFKLVAAVESVMSDLCRL
ncbi:MAG: hypothetical protein ACLGIM_03440, partial [Alphaproteobacteria bacterium]